MRGCYTTYNGIVYQLDHVDTPSIIVNRPDSSHCSTSHMRDRKECKVEVFFSNLDTSSPSNGEVFDDLVNLLKTDKVTRIPKLSNVYRVYTEFTLEDATNGTVVDSGICISEVTPKSLVYPLGLTEDNEYVARLGFDLSAHFNKAYRDMHPFGISRMSGRERYVLCINRIYILQLLMSAFSVKPEHEPPRRRRVPMYRDPSLARHMGERPPYARVEPAYHPSIPTVVHNQTLSLRESDYVCIYDTLANGIVYAPIEMDYKPTTVNIDVHFQFLDIVAAISEDIEMVLKENSVVDKPVVIPPTDDTEIKNPEDVEKPGNSDDTNTKPDTSDKDNTETPSTTPDTSDKDTDNSSTDNSGSTDDNNTETPTTPDTSETETPDNSGENTETPTTPSTPDTSDKDTDNSDSSDTTEELDGLLKDRVLIWHDEFDGNELNTENWTVYTGTHSSEPQLYVDDGTTYSVKDSVLTIKAIKEDTEYNGTTYKWKSAWLSTQYKHNMRKGRFEAKVKYNGKGVGDWAAFWLMSDEMEWARNGEVDIMEYFGDGKASASTCHYQVIGETNVDNGGAAHNNAGCTDWQVFAVEIDDDNITFFVDGVQTSQWSHNKTSYSGTSGISNIFCDPFVDTFHYAILNLALYNKTLTDDVSDTKEYSIDWVRFYAPKEKTEPDVVNTMDVTFGDDNETTFYLSRVEQEKYPCVGRIIKLNGETDSSTCGDVGITKLLTSDASVVSYSGKIKSAGKTTLSLGTTNGLSVSREITIVDDTADPYKYSSTVSWDAEYTGGENVPTPFTVSTDSFTVGESGITCTASDATIPFTFTNPTEFEVVITRGTAYRAGGTIAINGHLVGKLYNTKDGSASNMLGVFDTAEGTRYISKLTPNVTEKFRYKYDGTTAEIYINDILVFQSANAPETTKDAYLSIGKGDVITEIRYRELGKETTTEPTTPNETEKEPETTPSTGGTTDNGSTSGDGENSNVTESGSSENDKGEESTPSTGEEGGEDTSTTTPSEGTEDKSDSSTEETTTTRKAIISIIDDDGTGRCMDNYTGLTTWLNNQDIPMAFALPKSQTKYTTSNIPTLQASGNEFVLHGLTTNDDFNGGYDNDGTFDSEQFEADLKESKAYGETMGITTNIMVYPKGLQPSTAKHFEDKITSIRKYFDYGYNVNTAVEDSSVEGYEDWSTYDNGKTTKGQWNVVPFAEMPDGASKGMLINRMEIARDSKNIATSWWKTMLDTAITNKGYVAFLIHSGTSTFTTADSDGNTGYTRFQAVINYILENYKDEVEFLTPSAAVEKIASYK